LVEGGGEGVLDERSDVVDGHGERDEVHGGGVFSGVEGWKGFREGRC
jgi:hypothetical protein